MATNYSDLQLDDTGDLLLTNNDLTLITENLISVRQRLAMMFNVWKEEWKFDLLLGFTYQQYLGKKIDKSIIDAKVRQTATTPPDVLRIENFTSTFSNRYYEAYFTVVTTELEEVNVAFFGTDEFDYPPPSMLDDQLCDVDSQIEFGGKLYFFLNFRLNVAGDATWDNQWD